MYLVSVLVPVYGVEKYIERCARSLFEQTYENIEYIFVDDCSPDKSIDILKSVIDDYPIRKEQVRIIRHKKNRGLAAARNTAIDNATGIFISHVDSDDYLIPDAIQLLVSKQLETGADIVTGNHFVIEPTRIKKVFEPKYKDRHEMLLIEISSRTETHYIVRRLINSRLYRDYHIRVKEGVDYMEDWQQIALLVYYAKKVARIEEHIYHYDRTNSNSYVANLQRNKALWSQSIEAASIVESFYEDKEPEYRELAHRSTIHVLKTRMSSAARFRERTFFEEKKKIIMTKYYDCYDEIGWNNPLVRAFMCNYTLNGIYRRFLSTMRAFMHR